MTGTPGTVLITGTTSGVGLNATAALVKLGWTVITANRSPQRAAGAADELDLPKDRLQHVLMDLGDLDSVRNAVAALPGSLDAVVVYASNAAHVREHLDAVPLRDPGALAVQPYAVARDTRFPDLAARLLDTLTTPSSRESFEDLGFGWRREEPGQ